MLAATGYELLTHWELLQASDVLMVGSGFATAFLCGLLAVSAPDTSPTAAIIEGDCRLRELNRVEWGIGWRSGGLEEREWPRR